MALFNRKSDPITHRAKQLNAQIHQLESEIRQLNSKLDHDRSHPRVRSTTLPHGPTIHVPPAPMPGDPIFENIEKLESGARVESTSGHYNDLGVRKYDLVGALKRFKRHFSGPPAANPKLVSYLAAGSIKGLRPLRYEKRIARNRFIILSIFFVCVLWGIFWVVFSHK